MGPFQFALMCQKLCGYRCRCHVPCAGATCTDTSATCPNANRRSATRGEGASAAHRHGARSRHAALAPARGTSGDRFFVSSRLAAAAIVMTLPLATQKTATTSDVAFISGCWKLEANGRTIEEHWLAPSGGSLMGVSRTVAGGKTVEYEFLQIRDMPDGLTYIAKPSGQVEATLQAALEDRRRSGLREPGARLSTAHPLSEGWGRHAAGAYRRDDERQVARDGFPVHARGVRGRQMSAARSHGP